MMAAFYSNENFPLPVVEHLRGLGHDVLTSQQAGNAGRAVPDEEVLAYAASANRVLLTMNRLHFLRLHRAHPAHAGIVVCTYDADFIALAARIHSQMSGQSLAGKLIRVNQAP